MIEHEGLQDFYKRVYMPRTKIEFISPYNKQNSFSDIKSICIAVGLVMEMDSPIIQNVTNGKICCEQDFLNRETFKLQIPKLIVDIGFLLLRN